MVGVGDDVFTEGDEGVVELLAGAGVKCGAVEAYVGDSREGTGEGGAVADGLVIAEGALRDGR